MLTNSPPNNLTRIAWKVLAHCIPKSESDKKGSIDNDAAFFHELHSRRGSWSGSAAAGGD
jgi:hypothetical protein